MKTFWSVTQAAAIVLGFLFASLAAWGLGDEVLPRQMITPVGDVLARLGVKIAVRVANNAELSAYRYGGVVIRNGYAAAGDGGAATYVHSGSPCSQNAGAGDGGWQIPDSAGTGCWQANLSNPISAAVWGARSDSAANYAPNWRNAISALGLNGGGTLVMPAGSSCSRIDATLPILYSSVKIIGSGADASCFGINFPTGNGIEIGGDPSASAYVRNVTLQDLSLKTLVAHKSGALFEVYRARNTTFRNVMCSGTYWICHSTDGALNGQQNTLDTEVSGLSDDSVNSQTGVCIGCLYVETPKTTAAVASGASKIPLSSVVGVYVGQFVSSPPAALGAPGALLNAPITAIDGNDVTVATATSTAIARGTTLVIDNQAPINTVYHHLELTNHNGAGELLVNVGGLLQDDINTDFNYVGLLILPLSGQQVSGVYSDSVNYDANGTYGILADTRGGGLIYSDVFNGQWVASCGSPITRGIVPSTTPADCIRFIGPRSTIFEMVMQLHVGAAGHHCIEMDSSSRDIALSGFLTACSFGSGNNFDGIYSNGATHWSWNGTIGLTSNVPGVYPQNQQYSVYLTGASDDVRLAGDLGHDASGSPIFNNATGTTFSYEGVLPALPWIAFAPSVTCGSGALGRGATASMHYRVIGRTIQYSVALTMGANSTCVGLRFSLPSTPAFPAAGTGVETVKTGGGFAGKSATAWVQAGSPTVLTQFYDSSATGGKGASNSSYVFSGVYEQH